MTKRTTTKAKGEPLTERESDLLFAFTVRASDRAIKKMIGANKATRKAAIKQLAREVEQHLARLDLRRAAKRAKRMAKGAIKRDGALRVGIGRTTAPREVRR